MAKRNPEQIERRRRDDRRLGLHLRALREGRGLTQDQLGALSGLAGDTVRRIEKGVFSPSLGTVRKLCGGLRIRLSTFFAGVEFGGRDLRRELSDLLGALTPEEQQALAVVAKLLLCRSGSPDAETG